MAAGIHGFADLDDFGSNAGAGRLEHAQRGAHDFGANAITVGDGNGNVLHGEWDGE